MNDFKSFCQTILNIDRRDKRNIIENIVSEEKKELLIYNNSTEGFCRYLANQILYRLQSINGIRTFLVDLTEIINFNHTILILEYRHGDNLKRLLIDPTFDQFVFKENKYLYKLQEWPSIRLRDKFFYNDLINKGLFEVDDTTFKQYLNAFSDLPVKVILSDYLMERMLNFDSSKKL